MNKAGLIGAVAEKLKLPKKDADRLVNTVLDTISETLAEGEKVQLVGFGVFEAKTRVIHGGRTFGMPADAEDAGVRETTTLQFRCGKQLKQAITHKEEV